MIDEILVVLPYKQSGAQGHELQIALKGWQKFCAFKYHFIIIGEFDESLKDEFPWVEFIYKKRIPDNYLQYIQHLDVQECMEIVMNKYQDKYEGFIWMVDDNYAIKPFDLKDIKTIHFTHTSFTGDDTGLTFTWGRDKFKTRQLLDRVNLPNYNYTTHFPCWFEFKKLKEIWDTYNMRNESYVLEDVYFNHFKHEEPVYVNTIRAIIFDKETFYNEFNDIINNPSIKFLCNNYAGWSEDLENELYKIVN